MIKTKQPALSIISTTSLGRVRGFTIELLFELKKGPRRCCEIAEITGKSRPHVYRYLKNMEIYGLTEKNSPFWNLTDLGISFISHLETLYDNIIKSRKIDERKKKESRKKAESYNPKRLKQVPIQLWLQNSSLDDTEKAVVEVLMDHYNKTGSKFLFASGFYELAERLKQNPSLLPQALRKLIEDNIIYVWNLKSGGYMKVGLKKDFIQKTSCFTIW